MALQFRRGTEAERGDPTFVPLIGEPVYTTDTKRLYIGDGSTTGGNPVGYNNKLSDLEDVELISEISVPISVISAAQGIVSIITTLPHGLETGHYLFVYSTSHAAINGVKEITVTGITSLTFEAVTPDFASTNDTGAVKYEPQDGAILAWDQASGKWGEQVYVYKLADLGDVRISNPQPDDIIQYTQIPVGNIVDEEDEIVEFNVEEPGSLAPGLSWTQTGTISKFLNKQFEIGVQNLTNVVITPGTLSDKQILAYDSFLELWRNKDYVDELDDLDDVEITQLPDLSQTLARITIGGQYSEDDIITVQIVGTVYTHTVTDLNLAAAEVGAVDEEQFNNNLNTLLANIIKEAINVNELAPVTATTSGAVITLNPKGTPVNLNLIVSATTASTLVPTITKFEPITEHVLSYDGEKWTNKALEINNFSLSALTDTDLDNVTNNQILQYNSSSNTWRNVDNFITLSQFADVAIDDPETGHALIYDPAQEKFLTRSFILDDLTDVNDPSYEFAIPDGSVLAYSTSDQAWKPQQFTTLASRTEISFNTGPLENLGITTADFEAFTGYAVFKVKASAPCTVTLYVSNFEREADLDRAEDQNPTYGQGIFAEMSPTDTVFRRIAPVIYGYNDDTPITKQAYAKVRNRSGYFQQDIEVTLVLLQIEDDPEQAAE